MWTAGIDMLERGVAAAVAVGEVPEVRPRVAAGMLVSGLQVWLSDWVESGFDRDVDVVVAEMREHLARLLGAV